MPVQVSAEHREQLPAPSSHSSASSAAPRHFLEPHTTSLPGHWNSCLHSDSFIQREEHQKGFLLCSIHFHWFSLSWMWESASGNREFCCCIALQLVQVPHRQPDSRVVPFSSLNPLNYALGWIHHHFLISYFLFEIVPKILINTHVRRWIKMNLLVFLGSASWLL